MQDWFVIGVIIGRSTVLKTKGGVDYVKWKISDLQRCSPEFIKAFKTKDKTLISKLNPMLQEIIRTSTPMLFSPEGYKIVEICFFGKVSQFANEFSVGDVVLFKNPAVLKS